MYFCAVHFHSGWLPYKPDANVVLTTVSVSEPPEDNVCPECGKQCASEQGLKMHFTGQHSDKKRGNQFPWEAEGDWECPTCGRLCANEAGMRRHHKWVHDESLARVERTCRECGETKEMYESELEQLDHDDLCQTCASERSIKHTEDAKRKIAENQPTDREWSEEAEQARREGWQQWWENEADQEDWLERLQNNRVELSEEVRQKISETLQGHEVPKETRRKISERSGPAKEDRIEVEETGHFVRNDWERQIDLLLHEAVDGHEYEPGPFDIGYSWYMPDFRVGSAIIEVKGAVMDGHERRAEAFMDEHPEKTYIVVGSELPADIHIEWENREDLHNIL